jgi:hypothetical protein
VQRQSRGEWLIDCNELDTSVHQVGNESHVTGQPVELGNEQRRPLSTSMNVVKMRPLCWRAGI